MVKSDKWLKLYGPQIFDPFEPDQIKHVDGKGPVSSYGVSSYGYDVRLAPSFRVFTNVHNTIIDPKKFDERAFVQIEGDECIIPPNSFCLGQTLEVVHIPRDTIALCIGKSTYARCGIIVNVTPLEPEWLGHVTIEISNTAPIPAKVYANEGIMQLLFLGGDDVCEWSYADRRGKYNFQYGITGPKM